MTAAPKRLIHLRQEVITVADVVILRERSMATRSENVGDLARDGCQRTASTDEVIDIAIGRSKTVHATLTLLCSPRRACANVTANICAVSLSPSTALPAALVGRPKLRS